MSARDRILGRLKAAAQTSTPELPALIPANGSPLAGDSLKTSLPTFLAALEAAHAEIIDARPSSGAAPGAWVALLNNFCKLKGVKRLLLPSGLTGFSADEAIKTEIFDRPIETFKDALFKEIDVGVTVADCGLADTGVLIQRSTPQQPRLLSLVPPIHFCLINVNRLYVDMRGAMAGEGWIKDMPSNLIFISGPSKTADIQQTLAYGAHGPKELIVILLEEDVLS